MCRNLLYSFLSVSVVFSNIIGYFIANRMEKSRMKKSIFYILFATRLIVSCGITWSTTTKADPTHSVSGLVYVPYSLSCLLKEKLCKASTFRFLVAKLLFGIWLEGKKTLRTKDYTKLESFFFQLFMMFYCKFSEPTRLRKNKPTK